MSGQGRAGPVAAPPRIAFYAPMKPPDHPTPSGDRQIARLTMRALAEAGFAVELASHLRVLDLRGDAETQARLRAEAEAEIRRIAAGPRPDLWFTYHCYWKAPDLIGPAVARQFDIPYAISEPSLSPGRLDGPWSGFARAATGAIAATDALLWTTERDRPALEAAGHAARMVHLPPFVETGPAPRPRPAGSPLRLLTVAMMRPGDKAESYRRLAAALAALDTRSRDWRLDIVGDGPARDEVAARLAPFAPRVRFAGATDEPAAIRAAMEGADLLVWPGVGEGVGMVWIEAQAAGLPVVAEDGPAARAVLAPVLKPLPGPGDAATFAETILRLAADRAPLSAAIRAHATAHHGVGTAARILARTLGPLIARSTGAAGKG